MVVKRKLELFSISEVIQYLHFVGEMFEQFLGTYCLFDAVSSTDAYFNH